MVGLTSYPSSDYAPVIRWAHLVSWADTSLHPRSNYYDIPLPLQVTSIRSASRSRSASAKDAERSGYLTPRATPTRGQTHIYVGKPKMAYAVGREWSNCNIWLVWATPLVSFGCGYVSPGTY